MRGDGRGERKPLPGMFFQLAFGARRILTRQEISPLSRLPGFMEPVVGTILNRKQKGISHLQAGSFPINSCFSIFYVLFLMRVRKRTKKKRALRQGAGFSVNHSGGVTRIGWPVNPSAVPMRMRWTDQHGKTPRTPGRTNGNPAIARDVFFLPLSLWQGGWGWGSGRCGAIAFDFAFRFCSLLAVDYCFLREDYTHLCV